MTNPTYTDEQVLLKRADLIAIIEFAHEHHMWQSEAIVLWAEEGDMLRKPDADRQRLQAEVEARDADISRLNVIINTPQADDFLRAVSTEAEHQRQRWGNAHDAGKSPPDWFWLIGYLAGKALHAHAAGNVEKAEHHIITTAAACANWHRAMFGKTDMRPGIDGEAALATPNETKEAKS